MPTRPPTAEVNASADRRVRQFCGLATRTPLKHTYWVAPGTKVVMGPWGRGGTYWLETPPNGAGKDPLSAPAGGPGWRRRRCLHAGRRRLRGWATGA